MNTCWHGEEGFCEICYAIVGDTHLKAVEKRNGENGKEKDPDLDLDEE